MAGANIFQSVKLFRGNTITGGFDAKLYGGNAYRNPETEIYVDHAKLHEVAGYISAQQELGRFMLNAGIRLENHELYGVEWIPQAGISFRAASQTHLKLSASKGFRTPNMRELYMYNSANEDLMPERSVSYDFSVTQGFLENRLSMELALYYITGNNIIESIEISPGVKQNRNVGEFANKGIEFSLNYQILKNLNMHTNYSYLHMDTPIAGAPEHKLYAGLSYYPGKFALNVGAQMIDKLILSTANGNTQASSYTLVDARVSYQALKWLDIFVKGNNLLAQKYETMQGYPMPRATFMGGLNINF
jgi:iron complex outermembrane receptor protein